MSTSCSRRAVLLGGAVTPMTLASCRTNPGEPRRTDPSAAGPGLGAGRGRLEFRPPSSPPSAKPRRGRFDISGVAGAQAAQVFVPDGADGEPLRLVLMLHGAGGVASSALTVLRGAAERHRLLLLAPQSTAATWDVVAGGYGPDVRNIDRLLTKVAATYRLRGYTVGGFSDGATYALSLGLTNGDVFDSVIAFSPGFQAAKAATGRPRVFISHGTEDRVLPIDRCSRRIVATLEKIGYPVTYHEFDGGHAIPEAMQTKAVEWLDAE